MRFGSATIRLIVFAKINKIGSKIGFKMSLIIVEAIRGRCASFMSLPAAVSEIFGGQTTPSILVVGPYRYDEYMVCACECVCACARTWLHMRGV